MKKIWPLLLTCLVVLAAILLPRGLSQLQDQRLFSQVQAETLPSDSALQPQTLELPERIVLISQQDVAEAQIQTIFQESQDMQQTEQTLQTVFASLADAGILAEPFQVDSFYEVISEKFYLCSVGSFTGAGFEQIYFTSDLYTGRIILDQQSDKVVALEMQYFISAAKNPTLSQVESSAAEIGENFAAYLEIPLELQNVTKAFADFVATDSDVRYLIAADADYLQILPQS